MAFTYLGVGLVAYTNFTAVSVAASAFPKILKDFIMLGMVGFVQAMAVKKQISVWMAVVLIFGMFAAVHYLDELIKADDDTDVEAVIESADSPAEPVTDGYLVELNEGASDQDLLLFAAQNGLEIERAFFPDAPSETLLDNYYLLTGDFNPSTLSTLTDVHYYEPNEEILVEPFILAEGGEQGSRAASLRINDPFTDEQWAMSVLEMDEYYRILSTQRPRKKAKIVILDTGVEGQHEDLDDNYFSIEPKYDNDPHGHGTHCAGIAAGVTNNAVGIGSLAGTNEESPYVEISSVKVLSAGGMGTQKTIIAGILEAADEGADVISLSLGGRSNQSSQRAYSAAVEYAHRAGAIVVAAAGNSNREAKDFAPANADGMITVAAIDEHLLRAPFSNRVGQIELAIAAPGVGIYSTVPGNEYKKYSGTSMACPFVAGLLGVMKSLEPELDHRAAYQILHDTGLTTTETPVTGRIVQPADAIAALLR
jgi:thermitase